ncbi:Uncharacterised protein [Burkholderia pseudomallei]|nr:Uncharacterised protein [Burkholderia pseudomallei]CAK0502338.1 Uncharacterised protein [Burkholderia pseudomallei]
MGFEMELEWLECSAEFGHCPRDKAPDVLLVT